MSTVQGSTLVSNPELGEVRDLSDAVGYQLAPAPVAGLLVGCHRMGYDRALERPEQSELEQGLLVLDIEIDRSWADPGPVSHITDLGSGVTVLDEELGGGPDDVIELSRV